MEFKAHGHIAGGRLEEAAADHSVLHRQDAPAEAVVVPETTLQGPVQLTPSDVDGLPSVIIWPRFHSQIDSLSDHP